MSDPCGIVDTIQSNFPTIDSVTAVACIGAADTTIGTALTGGDAEDGGNNGSSSPKDDQPDAASADEKPFDEDAKDSASKGKETESKPTHCIIVDKTSIVLGTVWLAWTM